MKPGQTYDVSDAGWNTGIDGTGEVYAADEKVTNLTEKNETDTGDKVPLAVLAAVVVIALIGAAAVFFGRRRTE